MTNTNNDRDGYTAKEPWDHRPVEVITNKRPTIDDVTTANPLTHDETIVVAHAINADPSEGKPYAQPEYVGSFVATYGARCVRATLADTSITNMTAAERAALESALAKITAGTV